MSTEETALRFLRAAVAAQFHKNGSFEPLLWNSAIVAMRISILSVAAHCRAAKQQSLPMLSAKNDPGQDIEQDQ